MVRDDDQVVLGFPWNTCSCLALRKEREGSVSLLSRKESVFPLGVSTGTEHVVDDDSGSMGLLS